MKETGKTISVTATARCTGFLHLNGTLATGKITFRADLVHTSG